MCNSRIDYSHSEATKYIIAQNSKGLQLQAFHIFLEKLKISYHHDKLNENVYFITQKEVNPYHSVTCNMLDTSFDNTTGRVYIYNYRTLQC